MASFSNLWREEENLTAGRDSLLCFLVVGWQIFEATSADGGGETAVSGGVASRSSKSGTTTAFAGWEYHQA